MQSRLAITALKHLDKAQLVVQKKGWWQPSKCGEKNKIYNSLSSFDEERLEEE